MTRKQLESYQANKRLVERNQEKIEKESSRDIPLVLGKVRGSSPEFPYTPRRFSVQMEEPVESDRSIRRIARWRREIRQAEKEMEEVEQSIEAVGDMRIREILSCRYIDGMKMEQIGQKLGYSKGRVSQILSGFLEDETN